MFTVCSELIETGPCKAYFIRYAYSSTDKRCVDFVYGGCGANGNNFQNLTECLTACKPGEKKFYIQKDFIYF